MRSDPYLAIINERVTGDPALHWFEMVLRDHLLATSTQDPTCLVLGSNEGSMEIALRQRGFAGRITASDIADKALARARVKVDGLGLSGIEHVVADLNEHRFAEHSFDFIVAEGVLHHVEKIDACMTNLRAALKPGGRLFAMEYVGAYRFQLPPLQVQWINAALGIVPRRYRNVPVVKMVDAPSAALLPPRPFFEPPSISAMMALDPSEAVSGHLLLDALGREFEVETLREAGGGLLVHLLGQFPFTATNTHSACAAWLRVLADLERTLYEQKIVPSDLVFVAARPRATPPPC